MPPRKPKNVEYPPLPYPNTRWILLTKDKFALVDEEDFELLSMWSWCFLEAGYAVRGNNVDGKFKMFYMHREIMNAPNDLTVDHKNRNKLDNRKCNLRLATETQQKGNLPPSKHNKSGYRGVTFRNDTGRWQARISIADKPKCLGCYSTSEEAAIAYDRAAVEHFGREFAVLNFPERQATAS